MTESSEPVQHRAEFDADLTFRNGGSLSARGFRLDIPGTDITADVLAALFVRHLGLLMVGDVRLSNVRVVAEPHRGSRETGVEPAAGDERSVVDLTHQVESGMITYPGLPAPEITDHLSWADSHSRYPEGTEFNITRISMVANTGTYVDAPSHRHRGSTDIAGLSLDRLADVPGVLVDVRGSGRPDCDRLALAAYEVGGKAVLIRTGWDAHWRTEGYAGPAAPYLTADGADWLVEQGAAVVGIDSINIDSMSAGDRPAHTRLLAAGIPIVEHLTGLGLLPADGFRFHAAPVPVRGMGTFPVRAFAVLA